jgi:hypothetical protein
MKISRLHWSSSFQLNDGIKATSTNGNNREKEKENLVGS